MSAYVTFPESRELDELKEILEKFRESKYDSEGEQVKKQGPVNAHCGSGDLNNNTGSGPLAHNSGQGIQNVYGGTGHHFVIGSNTPQ